MNVGKFNQALLSTANNQINRKRDQEINSIAIENTKMHHSNAKKDDLLTKFWNMTDSMPRDNQVAFAATVVANRIMKQGITEENKSFMQNISNRFSPEEIGALKNQVKNHPAVAGHQGSDIEKFFADFDQFISNNKSTELEPLKKQQANPPMRSPEDIFFQTTFNSNLMGRVTPVV